ncbi:MAG: sensor histidine kinase [Firmicutes bacterium]|nr:sensor histidine kinase [Bacillota bacterium]
MRPRSIRFRLMVVMICLATLPIIMVTGIAARNTRSSIEEEIIKANTSRMLWASQYLEELIHQIDRLFYSLQINQQLIDSFDGMDHPDVGAQYRAQRYIREVLTSAFYANSRRIDELTLFVKGSGKTVSVDYVSNGTVTSVDVGSSIWSRMLDEPINMYFRASPKGIYALHSINRFQDQEMLGGFAVRLNTDTWNELKGILLSEVESSVWVLNDEGEMVSDCDAMDIPHEIRLQLGSIQDSPSEPVLGKTKDYFYFIQRIGTGQLTVIKTIPSAMVSRSSRATIRAGIVTAGLFALLSILLSIFLSFRISQPIVSLAETMKKTQLHEFEWKPVHSYDEITLLEQCYNSMMQRIRDLVQTQYQREIELRNAQLMALQAQINPHFLNNTMSLIGGMALSKGVPDIYKIAKVVGDLMRYAMGGNNDLVTLEDELSHMRNYLFIQEHRFAERCTTIISVDERALDSEIPKFTLLPIVENAFEHGLHPKAGQWELQIRVKRIGHRIAFIVRDNGVGFTDERLREIRGELKTPLLTKASTWQMEPNTGKRRRGIGLKNVDTRLKLQFGSKNRVRVFSELGKGTVVVLTFPASGMEV